MPTQFSGTYASHLPSYDKMSFWSIIVDLLIDIAVNVKTNLSATDVMGYVLFCSLECNGTVLPVGIISRRMRTSSTRLLFKTMIEVVLCQNLVHWRNGTMLILLNKVFK